MFCICLFLPPPSCCVCITVPSAPLLVVSLPLCRVVSLPPMPPPPPHPMWIRAGAGPRWRVKPTTHQQTECLLLSYGARRPLQAKPFIIILNQSTQYNDALHSTVKRLRSAERSNEIFLSGLNSSAAACKRSDPASFDRLSLVCKAVPCCCGFKAVPYSGGFKAVPYSCGFKAVPYSC